MKEALMTTFTHWIRIVVHHAIVHPLYALPFGEGWRDRVDKWHNASAPVDHGA